MTIRRRKEPEHDAAHEEMALALLAAYKAVLTPGPDPDFPADLQAYGELLETVCYHCICRKKYPHFSEDRGIGLKGEVAAILRRAREREELARYFETA